MKKIILFASALYFMAACNEPANNSSSQSHDGHAHDSAHNHEGTGPQDSAQVLFKKDGISIAYFEESPDFPDAKLTYMKPDIDKPVKEGKTLFQYKVENFQLTEQTADAAHKHCNNSEKGQHIHHILNNEPYTAHYTDTFSKNLKAGHYVNLAFLSRSYHESIKHKGAYQLNQFSVGKAETKSTFDASAPHMFYSRPKGDYVGADTKKILLDFYLVNTELSENGNKVRAIINKTEFMLTKWAPYAIYGLPMGENTISLELVDKDNKVIPGPFNKVERKITLKEQ